MQQTTVQALASRLAAAGVVPEPADRVRRVAGPVHVDELLPPELPAAQNHPCVTEEHLRLATQQLAVQLRQPAAAAAVQREPCRAHNI